MTRARAKAAGLTRYFTGKPCPRGHIAEREVSWGKCITCRRERSKSLRKSTADRRHAEVIRQRRKQRSTSEKRRKYNGGIARRRGSLVGCLRSRLNIAIRSDQRAGSAVRDLGCSISEFRDYIAVQFQPGMSWDNHGEWHLDHRKPLASFNLLDREQFLQAVHFSNYQPLWAADNIAKGARL